MAAKDFTVILSSDTDKIISLLSANEEFKIRTNVFTEDEFKCLFKLVNGAANLKFHRYFKNPNVKQYVYSESFVCHRSGIRAATKDLQCPVKVTVRIKKNTYHNRRSDKRIVEYPCFIYLEGHHSHEIQCIQSVSQLKALSPAKKQLHDLFKQGLGPKEALCDMKSSMTPKEMANRSLLPNLNTAYYEFTKYTSNLYGDLGGDSMMEAIDQLKTRYPETTILLQVPTPKKRFCLFLQTPLMIRALRQIKQASEIIFMDSTSSLDQLNSSLTTFHTWTPAGAIPIGLGITETQTIMDYEEILSMLKSTTTKTGFFGAPQPESFMTDDCDAEKAALSKIFPDSKRLLCQFHVLQALWRWLWDKSHKIEQNDRKTLMLLVRKLVVSPSKDEFHSNYQNILNNCAALKYAAFLRHIEEMMINSEEWAQCFRTTLRTRGHNTNNFAERAMGTIKSTVLKRKKVYNVTALAEVLIVEYETIIKDRLLDVALMREKARHNPKNLNPLILKDHIERDKNSSLFFVRSQSDPEQRYLIDVEIPMCNCGTGSTGSLCKHLIAIEHWFPNTLTLPRAKTKEELFNLLQLAVGEDASNYLDFFQVSGNSNTTLVFECQMANTHCSSTEYTSNTESNTNPIPAVLDQTAPVASTFEESCDLLKQCFIRFSGSDTLAAFGQMKKVLLNLRCGSKANFLSAVHNFGRGWTSSKKRARTGSLIRVQPTAKSRRKDSDSRGNAPLMHGKVLKKTIFKKREHNLIKNIRLGVPNAKKH